MIMCNVILHNNLYNSLYTLFPLTYLFHQVLGLYLLPFPTAPSPEQISKNQVDLKPSFDPQSQIKSEAQLFPLPVQFQNDLFQSFLEFVQFFISRQHLATSPQHTNPPAKDIQDLSSGLASPSYELPLLLLRFLFYLIFCLLGFFFFFHYESFFSPHSFIYLINIMSFTLSKLFINFP